MIKERCSPYSWEIQFYNDNNIPLWECNTHETFDLGVIFKNDDDGSYIKAKVNPWPAQFWEFEIGCGEDECLPVYKVKSGSGGLSNFFPIMKLIADGMLDIDKIPTH